MKILGKILRKVNRIIENTTWYNNYWGGVCKFWRFEKKYVKAINLGSNSAKHAFVYACTGVPALNMALGPQSLAHDYSILKNYFSYLEEGGAVFIPVCPFSCMKVSYSKQHNLKYYTILHPATIENFCESERVKALSVQHNPIRTIPQVCLINTLKSIVRCILPKKRVVVNYAEHADEMISMWKGQFKIDDLSAPLSLEHLAHFKERAELLKEMIVFCKERNLKPYVVLPPSHKELVDRMGEKFMKSYVYDFIKEAGAEDITLDYFADPAFHKDELFANSFYMSKKGAELFTKSLLARIELL